jgi:hypothetical protein
MLSESLNEMNRLRDTGRMETAQLSIFDPPPQVSPASAKAPDHAEVEGDRAPPALSFSPGESYAPGVRVRIAQASSPLEHLNGRLGEIISVSPGLALVQIEGIAIALMLQVEAIEKYTEVSQFMDDEAPLIEVGCTVECDYAFVGKTGVVRRIERYCGALVAWVDYGPGVPLYPAAVDNLSLA